MKVKTKEVAKKDEEQYSILHGSAWGVCVSWQPHRQPGRSIQPQLEAGASVAPEAPDAHTQVEVGLASSVMRARAALWGLRVQPQSPQRR